MADKLHQPDYTRSLVNLMASIGSALGAGDNGYAPLVELPPSQLQERPVILLLIDGMGETVLEHFPDSHLARARVASLTSVFPSTTASAVTSYTSGAAPQQHAITGWHMWLKELGSVAAILPFAPRHGGPSYSSAGWNPAALIGARPLFERINVPGYLLSPGYIADSDYSRASAGPARRLSHNSMEEFFDGIVHRARSGTPSYTFAYWTELDGLAHYHGIHSPQVSKHFLALDKAFGETVTALRGSGALLLVSADHGLIDTTPERTLRLEEHPALATTLALPLCGEPRAAYCYVRPGQETAFLDYVNNNLAHACDVLPSVRMVADGWFGRGTPHPHLLERIGDYVLLMKENYVLRDRLANERPFSQIGVHGGASRAEMAIPLLRCAL